MNNVREKFEAWVFRDIPTESLGDALRALRNSMREDGNYANPLMQAFWEGFQGAWRAASADAAAPSDVLRDANRYRKCREHAVERGFLPTGEQYDAMVDESIERMEVSYRTSPNYGKKMQPDGSLKAPIREPGYDIHGDRLG